MWKLKLFRLKNSYLQISVNPFSHYIILEYITIWQIISNSNFLSQKISNILEFIYNQSPGQCAHSSQSHHSKIMQTHLHFDSFSRLQNSRLPICEKSAAIKTNLKLCRNILSPGITINTNPNRLVVVNRSQSAEYPVSQSFNNINQDQVELHFRNKLVP